MAETPGKRAVATDPENATTFMQVPLVDGAGIMGASMSPTQTWALDQLGGADVPDLVADTLSRGNKDDARFRKQELARR